MRRNILLKLTGESITTTATGLNGDLVRSLAKQIKQLPEFCFSIVMGGGNFFRGAQQAQELSISPGVSHYVGMLATVMNGLIVQEIFEQAGIETALFCALSMPEIGQDISAQALKKAQKKGACLIFTGGTGNPYVTTDTTAVIRALQVGAHELWKGTKVPGVYTDDPQKNPQATLIPTLSYKEALEKELHIMDLAAFALAQEHNLPIRIFTIFSQDALIDAAYHNFGSVIR
jgi:uridylate kinase